MFVLPPFVRQNYIYVMSTFWGSGHSLIKSIQIEEDRFGVEPEIIAKLARAGCRIYEVGISYDGRTYREGKKVNWKDGLRAIYAIVKYNLERRQT